MGFGLADGMHAPGIRDDHGRFDSMARVRLVDATSGLRVSLP